jgi:hypothetical protein
MSGRVIRKRRFPRRRFRRPIGFLLDGKYQIVTGEEIGEGGISLFTSNPVRDGKPILLTFALEGDLHIMRGVVRYSNTVSDGSVLGIAFDHISFKFKKLIRRYIGAKTEEEMNYERKDAAAYRYPEKS